jgi:hypothetical protein
MLTLSMLHSRAALGPEASLAAAARPSPPVPRPAPAARFAARPASTPSSPAPRRQSAPLSYRPPRVARSEMINFSHLGSLSPASPRAPGSGPRRVTGAEIVAAYQKVLAILEKNGAAARGGPGNSIAARAIAAYRKALGEA